MAGIIGFEPIHTRVKVWGVDQFHHIPILSCVKYTGIILFTFLSYEFFVQFYE